MARAGLAAMARRRPMVAGSVSLVVHGALIGAAVVLTSSVAGHAPELPALTTVEVVDAVRIPAPPVAPQVSPLAPVPPPRVVTHSRRAPETPQRAPSKPAAVKDLLDDVSMSYDDPDNFRMGDATEPVDGDSGVRSAVTAGVDRNADAGLATLQMPAPVSASLARSPRPKHDYHRLRMHSVAQFAGLMIKLLLIIDERGAVREVQILRGVERTLDRRTVELVQKFQFEPALDDVGTPVPGRQRWDILIVDEAKEKIKPNLERGFY